MPNPDCVEFDNTQRSNSWHSARYRGWKAVSGWKLSEKKKMKAILITRLRSLRMFRSQPAIVPTARTAPVGLVLVLALIPAAIAQTVPGSQDDQGLTGSWFGTAVATSVPLPPSPELLSLVTFTRDGGVVETRRLFIPDSPLGPLLATPGHGSWVRTGANQFAVTLIAIYEGGPTSPSVGVVVAVEKIRFKLRLDPNNGHLTGTLLDELRDTKGNVLFVGTGRFDATRITVEPLP